MRLYLQRLVYEELDHRALPGHQQLADNSPGRKSISLQTTQIPLSLIPSDLHQRNAWNRWRWSQRPLGLPLSDFHTGLVKQWRRKGDYISIFILITGKVSFIIHRYSACLGCLIKKDVIFFLPLCDHRKQKPLKCVLRINCYQNRSWCPLITVLSNRHL